jgi:hypothetical protein
MGAMAAGVIPLMPDIHCQTATLLKEIGFGLYPKGEIVVTAAYLKTLIAGI